MKKLALKTGFSLALLAVLAFGFSMIDAAPASANSLLKPNTGTCGTIIACSGSNLTYQYGGCSVVLGHDCIGVNCEVYRNNNTGQLCYAGCDWY